MWQWAYSKHVRSHPTYSRSSGRQIVCQLYMHGHNEIASFPWGMLLTCIHFSIRTKYALLSWQHDLVSEDYLCMWAQKPSEGQSFVICANSWKLCFNNKDFMTTYKEFLLQVTLWSHVLCALLILGKILPPQSKYMLFCSLQYYRSQLSSKSRKSLNWMEECNFWYHFVTVFISDFTEEVLKFVYM